MFLQKLRNKSIFTYFRVVLIIFTISSALAIALLVVVHQAKSYQQSARQISDEKTAEAEQFIKNMVNIEMSYLGRVKGALDDRKIKELEANVREAHRIASTIYKENYSKMTTAEMEQLIIRSIASLHSATSRQYVTINTTKGVGVYNPSSPEFNGKDLTNIKDRTGTYFAREEIRIVREQGEGFRYSTDTITGEKKVVFLQEFRPLDWYFVALVYPSDYYGEFISEVASKVSLKFFGYNGDAFIVDKSGRAITFRGKVYQGEDYFNFTTSADPAAQHCFQLISDSLRVHPEGALVRYPWYPQSVGHMGNQSELAEKTSFVKIEPSLGWIVGAGFFGEEVAAEIETQVAALRIDFILNVGQIFLLFALILVLEMLLLRWFEEYFKSDFNSFTSFFRKSGQDLTLLKLDDISSKEFKELGAVANEMIIARKIIAKNLHREQEKAQEADRLKSSFLGNMSHEIRTPTNAIVGFADLLTEELSAEERKEIVSLIKESGESLLGLLDSIMDFAKIETGQIILHKKLLSFEKLSAFLREKYQSKIAHEHLNLVFKLTNKLPSSFATITDEHRLMQVLESLIDQAFKSTRIGKIELTIEQHEEYVYFQITDSGTGISPDNQAILAKYFASSQEGSSRQHKESEVDLAISAKLITLLGGKIWLKSTSSKGSVFQFCIPAVLE